MARILRSEAGGMEQRTDARRERWWRMLFLVLATVYVALLLARLVLDLVGGFVPILLTLFLAWLLAFVLSPVVGWLVERTGVRRGAAVGLVYAITLVGSALLLFYAGSAIGSEAGQFIDDFPETRVRIVDSLGAWQEAVSIGPFEPDLVRIFADAEREIEAVSSSAIGEAAGVTLAAVGGLVLVIVLSLYMVADSERILLKLARTVPSRWENEAQIFERTMARAFGGFLRAQLQMAAIQAALTVAVGLAVGLPYLLLVTAISALAMLVPFFGPPLALLPPLVALALFRPEWLLVAGPLLLIVQTVLVNYLQPRLMRDALGMHPLLVLVGLLVGAQVAGLWGALFGIPVVAVLNVFFNYMVNLRTIEDTPGVETEEVLEEVRREAPDAGPEEIAAIAAERAEANAVAEGGAEEVSR